MQIGVQSRCPRCRPPPKQSKAPGGCGWSLLLAVTPAELPSPLSELACWYFTHNNQLPLFDREIFARCRQRVPDDGERAHSLSWRPVSFHVRYVESAHMTCAAVSTGACLRHPLTFQTRMSRAPTRPPEKSGRPSMRGGGSSHPQSPSRRNWRDRLSPLRRQRKELPAGNLWDAAGQQQQQPQQQPQQRRRRAAAQRGAQRASVAWQRQRRRRTNGVVCTGGRSVFITGLSQGAPARARTHRRARAKI